MSDNRGKGSCSAQVGGRRREATGVAVTGTAKNTERKRALVQKWTRERTTMQAMSVNERGCTHTHT